MQRLIEIEGQENKSPEPQHTQERLVEVTNSGQKSQMTRQEVDQLKERQDIRVNDQGDKATILNKIRG